MGTGEHSGIGWNPMDIIPWGIVTTEGFTMVCIGVAVETIGSPIEFCRDREVHKHTPHTQL